MPTDIHNPLVTYAEADLDVGRFDRVLTRFAPEPNAFIHLGSAISCAMSYGVSEALGGEYNLRFDDTNPDSAVAECVDAIKEDLRWLGYEWAGEFYASDYFEQLYEWAIDLIRKGKAYVCDLRDKEFKEYRGTNSFDPEGKRITPPGRESPYRGRSVEENIELFRLMRAGEFERGSRTLRAKIDMGHHNLLMRDPVMYRIRHESHYRSLDRWCIYPTYDWAHGQSDSIEGITHSICGLEFRTHRPLYDWFLDELGIHHPRQIEYTRINVTHTVTGKRYLKKLVDEGIIEGWNDPRLPTLRSLRRRGIPSEAIRDFCRDLSVSDKKVQSTVEVEFFEHIVRDRLNACARRYMAVLRPVRLIITNYPEGEEELLDAVNNPEDPSAGNRTVPFGRELYIESEDFLEDPPRKFYRLTPGREVRLRYAYFITCTGVEKTDDGSIAEILATYDPATRGGDAPDGRKVKSTLHWVSAAHGRSAEVRLYDRLFADPEPLAAGDSWRESLNADSVEVVEAKIEPGLAEIESGDRVQFERIGYFASERVGEKLVFHRTLSLRDGWKPSTKPAERNEPGKPRVSST